MKTLFILFALFISIPNAHSQALTDSLLIYYPFTGNSNDMSGNGFNATGNATLVADRIGNSSSAMYFNGTNSYLDFPVNANLKPQLPVSFSFWTKIDDISLPTFFVTTDFRENNYSGCFINCDPSGTIAMSFGDGSGTTSSTARRTKTGYIVLQNNTWYHIACVIRGATDMDLYVDCVKDSGYYHGSGGNVAYSSIPGSLGRMDASGNPPWYFKGTIDDFRYWHRALTANDIDQLCTETPTSVQSNIPEENISVYPNPANERLLFSGQSKKVASLVIYNSLGQIVLTNSFRESIDISSLPSGFYSIGLFDNSSNVVAIEKFIKQ